MQAKMKSRWKVASSIALFLGAVVAGLVFLFNSDIAVLNPKGWVGMQQRELIIIAMSLMLLIVLPVLILTFVFAWKYRASNTKATYAPDWDRNHLAEILWWAVPLVIIAVLSVITWKSCHELDPFKPLNSHAKPLKIQVVALDWKWLFIYPEQNIATLNFVQFPEETPIDFEITSDAPMNSFWIPQLGGQVFAMSGMRTKLQLIANETGNFRGCSANISGQGFSGMTFTAHASSPDEFATWVSAVKQASQSLNLGMYTRLAEPSSYNPVAQYSGVEEGLFDWIVMKYMMPSHK